jgi:hypothetical protein
MPDHATDEAVQAPAPERWVLVFERKPGAPAPMQVLMRRLVKHANRYYWLRVVEVLNDVPHPAFEPVEFSEEE